MDGGSLKLGRHGPRAAAILALTLIVATALAALIVASDARGRRPGDSSLVCSLDDRGPIWPLKVRVGSRKALVPDGAMSLTVCGYTGMNAADGVPQFGLRGIGVIADRATIAQLTHELDALKPARGSFSCPMDDGSQDIAAFSYRSGPSVVVTIGSNGCNQITNGHVRRLGLGKPVVAQVGALAKPVKGPKWATVVGRIRLCGGPAPGRCWFQKETFPYASQAVATNARGLWVAMAQLEHNRFRFTIAAPGSYRFELMGSGKKMNTVISRTKATVRAGSTTNVVFTIPVP